jgi:hypothetical protein
VVKANASDIRVKGFHRQEPGEAFTAEEPKRMDPISFKGIGGGNDFRA